MKKPILMSLVISMGLLGGSINAQNVGINTSGAAPDQSAILDLTSSNKGFLMTRSDTLNIVSPAMGLMTINPSDSCIYIYTGSKWNGLGGGGCCCLLSGNISPDAIVSGPGTIASLDCAGAVVTGSLLDGIAASNASATITYSGGDGNAHGGDIALSTGVLGLQATISSGNFVIGGGTLTYSITGTPTSAGVAFFAINIGGQNCIFSANVLSDPYGTGFPVVFCNGLVTDIVDVTTSTGRTWMLHNLGASREAQALNDTLAYGDLYQWGRASDGHQCRYSPVTITNASTVTPLLGNVWDGFFITESSAPYDWLAVQDNNLWQGVNGVNNPCPTGYLLPTKAEWDAETVFFSTSTQAFNYALKLTMVGYRSRSTAALGNVGSTGGGYYWSSTVTGTSAYYLSFFGSGSANTTTNTRANGYSVRCIKDVP